MDLITVAEIEALPDDPAAAFVQLERICRSRLQERTENEERYEHGDDTRLEYMTIVASAAATYGVAEFDDPLDGWHSGQFKTMYQRAVGVATKLAIEGERARALNSVSLSQGAKERLKKHVKELRTALADASLDEKRKRVLSSKLDDFEKEIDRQRSNITVFLTGVALVSAAINQATGAFTGIEDGVIKLPEAVNAINVLLGREKLKELEATPEPLPLPPSVTQALPAPKLQWDASKPGFGDDLDDDIPF